MRNDKSGVSSDVITGDRKYSDAHSTPVGFHIRLGIKGRHEGENPAKAG